MIFVTHFCFIKPVVYTLIVVAVNTRSDVSIDGFVVDNFVANLSMAITLFNRFVLVVNSRVLG